jgi:hypothetical protein
VEENSGKEGEGEGGIWKRIWAEGVEYGFCGAPTMLTSLSPDWGHGRDGFSSEQRPRECGCFGP